MPAHVCTHVYTHACKRTDANVYTHVCPRKHFSIHRYGEGLWPIRHSVEMALEGSINEWSPKMSTDLVDAMRAELGLESNVENPFFILRARAGSVIVTVGVVHDDDNEARALLERAHEALKNGRLAKHGFRPKLLSAPSAASLLDRAAEEDPSPLEANLVTFYKKHAPEKVPMARSIAKQFIELDANMETINAELMKTYGEDLDGNTSASSCAGLGMSQLTIVDTEAALAQCGVVQPVTASVDKSAGLDHRQSELEAKIAAFYSQHAPEKLVNAHMIAECFVGKEQLLNSDLMALYGEDLDGVKAESPLLGKLTKFYERRAPEKISRVPMIAARYVGHEPSLNDELVALYGEGLPPDPTVTERLAIYYARHAPQGGVDNVLRAPYIAASFDQHELDEALTEQYGLALPPVPTTDFEHLSLFGRLVLFYAEHAPERLQQVDEVC